MTLLGATQTSKQNERVHLAVLFVPLAPTTFSLSLSLSLSVRSLHERRLASACLVSFAILLTTL